MLKEFFLGFAMIIGFFVLCAVTVFTVRLNTKIPDEWNRKLIHIFPVTSILVWIHGFQTWWISAASAVVFIALIYPIITVVDKHPRFAFLASERKHGEVRQSLVLMFGTYALLITVCWGLLGEKWLAVAAVFAWGFGDAAAALVGKKYGKHHFNSPLIEEGKSVEGSAAMFVVSFVSVLAVMLVYGELHWYAYIPIAAVTALLSAAVELISKHGLDTVTCPLSAMALLILLVRLWGAL